MDQSFWNATILSPEFKIKNMCYETYPCQHEVYINGTWKLEGGKNIKKLLEERNLENHSCYSHFRNY